MKVKRFFVTNLIQCALIFSLSSVSVLGIANPITSETESLLELSGVVKVGRTIKALDSEPVEYNIAFSDLKKVKAKWVAEENLKMQGQLTRQVVELQHKYELEDAWKNLVQYFQSSFELAFSCVGLDCGSSNAWANNWFEIRQLYGLEATQKYSVWRRNLSAKESLYVITYGVTRGNKRSYLLLDQLVVEGQVPVANLSNGCEAKGFESKLDRNVVRWKSFSESKYTLIDEVYLEEGIVNQAVLKQVQTEIDSASSVTIVGHDFSINKYSAAQEKAMALASRVAEQLGVQSEGKSRVLSVGNMSPEGKQELARGQGSAVVIILQ